jgi:flagellar basal body-associated protein FliL
MNNLTITIIIIVILIILIITGIIIYLFLLKEDKIISDIDDTIVCNNLKDYSINELRDYYEFTDDDLILF